ncbi:hypothetical protein BH20ACT23_BH20ACT23_16760 [soil metagenome]
MRLGLAIALSVLAGCAAVESPRSQTREGRPVAAPFVEIVCTKGGDTRLWTPVVEVQPDGVHVDVENRAGEPTSFCGFTLDVEEGRHEEVISEPPGRIKIACYPDSQHESDTNPVRYDLELVDPRDHWVSTELECEPESMMQSSISDFAYPLGKGLSKDPVELAQDTVKGLESDDVVEIAGYPEAEVPTVRVERDGKVIGVFGFLKAEDGGLVIETSDLCASEGLRG